MPNILAIFGATGQQGSSVLNHVLTSPTLSTTYTIRAITRTPTSPAAVALSLSQKVQVVQADTSSLSSLTTALSGVHTIFAMTTATASLDPCAEFTSAKNIADAAVSQGVKYLIFSTLPPVTAISGGKYRAVTPFDAKARAETYIRGLEGIQSAFFCPGSFMENFAQQGFLAPRWVMERCNGAGTKVPLIDAVGDSGRVVGAMLAEPERFVGRRVCAAERWYSLEEIVGIISRKTGKRVVYRQISVEEFRERLAVSLPGMMVDVFVDAFQYGEEFGYFGPGGEEEVKWAKENVGEKLTSLEEFLERHPLKLE
ncbi:putative hscarg dehydrogenase [Mollisia scopiformis]|uniref:Putative hscarg dehydrogenase n=1 Tax=Mollisia scopiformis TaxID=149040 RepID=A0A132BB93_MOLSC|nr:putative hscarg dehydrogenase [Mollisia scopiformis]KUJ09692.1 putative hscarg dehydrogenase [Mollisia scopiformis]